MPTYHLDSSPTLFIGCPSYGNPNDLIYIRDFTNEQSATEIAQLDPKSEDDILVVYGTEIKGDMLRNLGKCTQLQRRSGSIRVNCNGAVYFGAGGPWHRTVDNAIFDWSPFGVKVPSSTIHSLSKKLDQRDKKIQELNQQIVELKAQLAQEELTKVVRDNHPKEDSKVECIKDEVESMKKTILDHGKEIREKDFELVRIKESVTRLERELDITKMKFEQSISVTELMQEAMNYAKNETNWYRQEITALRMEISQHGRVSQR